MWKGSPFSKPTCNFFIFVLLVLLQSLCINPRGACLCFVQVFLVFLVFQGNVGIFVVLHRF